MNNREIQRQYLRRFAADYTATVVRPQAEIYRVVNPMLGTRARGDTLIVGAGPQWHIEDTRIGKVTALDYSESMLRQADWRNRASPVCADAAALPFDRGTFDTVILPFVVHHLGQDTVFDTDKIVGHAVAEASRVLRRNGRLIVVDLFLPQWFEMVERMFYSAAVLAMHQFARPMMFFYSLPNFREIIADNPLRVADVKKLELHEELVITLLAPRWKVSPRRHPAKFHFIECEKQP